MVPLIDTFFLILAFFVSSVLTMEVVRGLAVELPRAGASEALKPDHRWIVSLDATGRMELEGEAVTLGELRRRLAGHPGRDDLRLGIRADQGLLYRRLVEVLAAVRQAGVSQVTLLTAPESEKETSS